MIFNWHRTSKLVAPVALVALAALGVSCTSGDGFQSADATQPGANAGTGQGGNASGDDGGNQGGGGSQSTGTDGGPGSGSCMPGQTEECWESVAGVSFGGEAPQGHATCHAGERTCGEDATWGACQGAVGPAAVDSCESGNDANCNGTPNEGCMCDDGDAPRACPDDSGCGTQSCTGRVWGSCVGDGVTLRCNPDAVDERQVCGTDGVWTADP
ncbi:MAG TPA: hypothetical protein VHO25_23495, partial [Polyangiaceae bacterium]|nr:hypothetical protein [Polyangiaceae bacterium]